MPETAGAPRGPKHGGASGPAEGKGAQPNLENDTDFNNAQQSSKDSDNSEREKARGDVSQSGRRKRSGKAESVTVRKD